MKHIFILFTLISATLLISNVAFSQAPAETPTGGGNSKQQRDAELKKKKRLEEGYKLVKKEEKKRFKRQSKEAQKQIKATKKKSEKIYKKRSEIPNKINLLNNYLATQNRPQNELEIDKF